MPTKKFSMNSKKGPNFVIAKRAPSGHCARCGNLDFYHGLLEAESRRLSPDRR